MEDNFHYLLLVNQALVHQALLEDLKDTELTIGQPKILDYLLDHNGSNQTQIAEACHIKTGSLTVILTRMEEHGMVERKVNENNRRSFYVYLTPYGEKLAQKVQNSFLQIEQKIFKGIPKEKREIFMEVFAQINANIQS